MSVRWISFLANRLDVYSRAELTWLGMLLPSRIEVPASSGEEIQYFRDMLYAFPFVVFSLLASIGKEWNPVS
jgi:hypothetical protein